jgi:ADP-ribosylglycohydrolase
VVEGVLSGAARPFPLGAIAGDVIGSVHEHAGTKTTDFPLFTPASCFTDDSVLTVAVAEVLASGGNYIDSIQRWARTYPRAGYGGAFRKWMWSEAAEPYGSLGNGSGMRASPVGWARPSLEDVLEEARRSAAVTHDHPEGIKGAQAVAAAVFLARTGTSKDELRSAIATRFGYDLSRRIDDIRPRYTFDVTCQGSVPEALIAFLESSGWEDAVRKAISLGGDADTLACMTGAVAEAFYGEVPPEIASEVVARLDDRIRGVMGSFAKRFVS